VGLEKTRKIWLVGKKNLKSSPFKARADPGEGIGLSASAVKKELRILITQAGIVHQKEKKEQNVPAELVTELGGCLLASASRGQINKVFPNHMGWGGVASRRTEGTSLQ